MRVLLTSGPVYSHLVPMMLPIASALQTSGHEVAVATSAILADELHRSRLRHVPLPRMLAPSQMASDPTTPGKWDSARTACRFPN